MSINGTKKGVEEDGKTCDTKVKGRLLGRKGQRGTRETMDKIN